MPLPIDLRFPGVCAYSTPSDKQFLVARLQALDNATEDRVQHTMKPQIQMQRLGTLDRPPHPPAVSRGAASANGSSRGARAVTASAPLKKQSFGKSLKPTTGGVQSLLTGCMSTLGGLLSKRPCCGKCNITTYTGVLHNATVRG
jgi:hypothetical protein